MSATLRKDGRYVITKQINGERRSFYGNTSDEAEMKMWEEIIRYKKGIGEYKPYSDSFGQIRKQWYKNKAPKTAATRKMYEVDCFKKIAVLDDKPIADIDELDIKRILDPLVEKSNIAEKVYMCLNQIFKYAAAKRIIRYNPIDLIARPIYKRSEKSKRALTTNEKFVIESTEWNHRQRLILTLYLNYGFRKQEATAFQKKNISILNRTITVDHANDYTRNIPKTKSPKSDAGKRVVPILDEDIGYFRELIKDLKEDDYLLQMINGKPLTQNSYRQLWESIRRRMRKTAKTMNLEIPNDLVSRICRHEYSIRIMNLSEREQMYLMGHEDISTTQKNYQTIGVEHINRKELNKISKKKNGSPSSAKK